MGDGWFHTGDAAVVHPDGYVQITDRLKDVIISGGENISSVEVEAMLLRHDAIQEVAVVGVPHEKWGEAPHAFVVFKSRPVGDAEALRAFCRENMAHFKVPHELHADRGAAEDGDREDSEVRVAEGPRQHQRAVASTTQTPTAVSDRRPHALRECEKARCEHRGEQQAAMRGQRRRRCDRQGRRQTGIANAATKPKIAIAPVQIAIILMAHCM